MPVRVRSYGKINVGLRIGERRDSGYHELRTVYHTIALHDVIEVDVARGSGIEIRCRDPRVPRDQTNTCWRVAERVMAALKRRGRVSITIEKRLPVEGGLGAASSNAVAAMFGLERALRKSLSPSQRREIAAAVGSDLNLFLLGGAVLGIGRGEQVFPLPELPPLSCLLALPRVGVSTALAFAAWDARPRPQLTVAGASDKMAEFSHGLFDGLSSTVSGVPARGGNRAETLLLDLVRAGIENDFESVVFPEYPELREVKLVLESTGAGYTSLSGSGSTLYGLFASAEKARRARARLERQGVANRLTRTLGRAAYWKNLVIE